MFNTLVQWCVYLLAAAGCYWGWNKMFFWLKQKDALIISRLVGAVIFFYSSTINRSGSVCAGLYRRFIPGFSGKKCRCL